LNPLPAPSKPTLKEALKFWTKLGFISFGGPAGQIAIMHEFLVTKKRWISDSRFLHALNYCMILPGPEAQQLATYIGWLLHGTFGGLAAGILFVLPSVFILLGLSIAYVLFGKLAWVAAIFYGLKPAVVAIVVLALIKIGKKSLISTFHYLIAAASFVCIFFFNIPFPLIIVAAIALGILLRTFFPHLLARNKTSDRIDEDECTYFLNKFSPTVQATFDPKTISLKIIISLVVGAIPLLCFLLRNDYSFWYHLSGFFTKAAFVTFGGAYAVLPYVAQESVENFQWLSQYEMIDGLALGETTPGPLIMVLVFVGFMAGYHHGGASLLDGTLGLLTTTFYTFLPCFLFILVGAPLIERTQEHERVKNILTIVTAAVVGVILNLTIYFGRAVLFPSGFINAPDVAAIIWLMLSLFALFRLKINMILWIVISGGFGLAYKFFTVGFF
jgi:chromate transporter